MSELQMRLFHFSDDPKITTFIPRSLAVAVDRGAERQWLNGPLVWATDAEHSLLYLFPRDCPRIVIWPTHETTREDRETWFGANTFRAITFVEEAWIDRLSREIVYRYDMPTTSFEDLDDVGMWVSRIAVEPRTVSELRDLPALMAGDNIDLRGLPRLTPLRHLWTTTLHASGIRMRNAQDWGKPGWTHSKRGRVVAI